MRYQMLTTLNNDERKKPIDAYRTDYRPGILQD